jgi:RNA polymerase sigma-70 factor (ECF subfamily)
LRRAAPQSSASWFGLARLYLLQGKFDQAEEWARKVVDSGQGDAIADKMLAAARAKELPEGLRLVLEPPSSVATDTQSYGVDSLPPVVVSTEPASGSRDVAPGPATIRVSFSKGMTPGTWSWSSAWSNSAPQIFGQPRYEADGRTCVVTVNLQPGRTYAFWLNSDRFKNFKDTEGRPAVPYLLIFETKKE